MIIINFKTYQESTGINALRLARICLDVSKKNKLKIIIGIQTADIYRVSSQVDIPIFSQHIEPIEPGRYTGWQTANAIKKAGAKGVFLNHSEHQYSDYNKLEQALKIAKANNLEVLVFADNLKNSLLIDRFNPDYIALEEPTLVSGNKAMVDVPELKEEIEKFSKSIKSVPIIGAGIKTPSDVKESLKLGIKGIAISSGIVKAKDPKKALQDLARVFK